MRRTTPSFSSLSATISIKCLLILLIASLSVLIIAPIQVQGITDNTKNSAEVEEEYIQKLSTGEKPSDFVQNKIDSHDVSTCNVYYVVRNVEKCCYEVLLYIYIYIYIGDLPLFNWRINNILRNQIPYSLRCLAWRGVAYLP
jgi:hypothetical protein